MLPAGNGGGGFSLNKNPSLRTLAAARLLRASLELHELDEEHR